MLQSATKHLSQLGKLMLLEEVQMSLDISQYDLSLQRVAFKYGDYDNSLQGTLVIKGE